MIYIIISDYFSWNLWRIGKMLCSKNENTTIILKWMMMTDCTFYCCKFWITIWTRFTTCGVTYCYHLPLLLLLLEWAIKQRIGINFIFIHSFHSLTSLRCEISQGFEGKQIRRPCWKIGSVKLAFYRKI